MSNSFKLCPTHFSRGGRKKFGSPPAPPSYNSAPVCFLIQTYYCSRVGCPVQSRPRIGWWRSSARSTSLKASRKVWRLAVVVRRQRFLEPWLASPSLPRSVCKVLPASLCSFN